MWREGDVGDNEGRSTAWWVWMRYGSCPTSRGLVTAPIPVPNCHAVDTAGFYDVCVCMGPPRERELRKARLELMLVRESILAYLESDLNILT